LHIANILDVDVVPSGKFTGPRTEKIRYLLSSQFEMIIWKTGS